VIESYWIYAIGGIGILLIFFIWSLHRRNNAAFVGIFLLLPLLSSPLWVHIHQESVHMQTKMHSLPRFLQPDEARVLGADARGRDVLATTTLALANTFSFSVVAMGFSIFAGMLLGFLSLHRKKILSGSSELIFQFIESVPFVFFLMIAMGVYRQYELVHRLQFTTDQDMLFLGIVLGFVSTPLFGRMVQQNARRELDRSYVAALHGCGVSVFQIFWRNIIRNNLLHRVIVQISVLLNIIILMSTAVDYMFEIGFGEYGRAGVLTLGRLLAQNREALVFGKASWAVLPPTFAILISVLGGCLVMEDPLMKVRRHADRRASGDATHKG